MADDFFSSSWGSVRFCANRRYRRGLLAPLQPAAQEASDHYFVEHGLGYDTGVSPGGGSATTDRTTLRRRHRNDEIACPPIYFMENYCYSSKSAAFSSDESSRPVPLLHHHHRSFSTGEQLNHGLRDGGSTRDRRGRRHGVVVGFGLCSHPGRTRRIVAGCSGFRPAPAALRSPSDRRRPALARP
jgi:hypothetical protein